MAISTGNRGGLNSDINVTPLVDVMLVLLIIMMLVAPMLQKGVDVKLPVAGNTTDHPETPDQTTVAITADKRFYVNSVQVPEAEMTKRVQDALEDKKERIVLIKGDEDAPYSAVMAALDKLREAGIEDIALITERRRQAGAPAAGGK